MADFDFLPLVSALRDESTFIEAWLSSYHESCLRMPGTLGRESLSAAVAPLIEALADALAPSQRAGGPPALRRLVRGSQELREVEKAAALLGGGIAATLTSASDVVGLMLALREPFAQALPSREARETDRLAEWLLALALEAFALAKGAAERERARGILEEGTPVLMVAPEVPAAFLIGRPESSLLDALFARLLLLVVRSGARTVILDCSGCTDPGHSEALFALERFARHRKVEGRVEVVVIGLWAEHEASWLEVGKIAGTQIRLESHFDRAVTSALDRAGYRLIAP